MGEKFEKFKETIADKTAKVVAFTRRHPVLTIIASNIVVAAVSGGVAYAKTKRDMSDVEGEAMDGSRETDSKTGLQCWHSITAREGYFYGNEIAGMKKGETSDRIIDLARGVEALGIDYGDMVLTIKISEDSYQTLILEDPDLGVNAYFDVKESCFDGPITEELW